MHYVRPTDPETSHEAAERLDEKQASFEAFGYFRTFCQYHPDGINAAEFEQFLENEFLGKSWPSEVAFRKAESLRRRLTELEKKYHLIETRIDFVTGKVKKRNRRQLYFLA